ncbi:MAG: hypothetical protein WBX38_00480 [Candidatus Sulfotelmatobacter sp.]
MALAADMTHEEQTVRLTYAKLAYANKLSVLVDNVARPDSALANPTEMQRQMDARLRFEFENFRVGGLADIANVRWDALVTKPQQELIFVVPASMPYRIKLSKSKSSTLMIYALASWQRYIDFDADWKVPTKQAIQELPMETLKPEVVYSRYAAYTVTVRQAANVSSDISLRQEPRRSRSDLSHRPCSWHGNSQLLHGESNLPATALGDAPARMARSPRVDCHGRGAFGFTGAGRGVRCRFRHVWYPVEGPRKRTERSD